MSNEPDGNEVPWVSIVLWIGAVVVAGFLLSGGFLWVYRTWAPQYEDARRETFEHTNSYVRGKQQYLLRLYGEWSQADEAHRSALCAIARNEAVGLDVKQLPTSIQSWRCVQ